MLNKAVTRRTFSLSGLAFIVSACGESSNASDKHLLKGVDYTKDNIMSDQDWANLSAREWQERLTEQEFYVLRKEGTERPFTSSLNDNKVKGTYVCAGCGQALFTSETKFDSGTGWPSFYDHIPGAINTKKDFKLIVPRTEYHCSRCGGHQGHVFKDGPRPTGLRYCNNGVALDFIEES